jgi:acetyl-CoA C-acetyltransferase
MNDACIVGWAHTPFGKHENEDIESLIRRVTRDAIADAGIAPEDVDEIYFGHFGAGLIKENFLSSFPMQGMEALRYKPTTRVENACASGTAAIFQGIKAIDAKHARIVLVVGAEKMTHLKGAEVNDALISASYMKEEADIMGGFAGVFGQIAQQYFDRYGDQSDALAKIAAKNHKNGSKNPLAQFRKDFGFEFCRNASDKNPVVAPPLKRSDCSAVSDGAAAIVLADTATARGMKKAIAFRAAAQVNDIKPMKTRDMTYLQGCEIAWKKAFEKSGTSVADLSCVETHDCFTVAELIEYEAMGLAPKGHGGRIVAEGFTEMGGRLPVNASGGLKAKGHPIGATGVSMHVIQSNQLMGTAGDIQVPNAKLAGIFNMGGAGVANYVSILERLK